VRWYAPVDDSGAAALCCRFHACGERAFARAASVVQAGCAVAQATGPWRRARVATGTVCMQTVCHSFVRFQRRNGGVARPARYTARIHLPEPRHRDARACDCISCISREVEAAITPRRDSRTTHRAFFSVESGRCVVCRGPAAVRRAAPARRCVAKGIVHISHGDICRRKPARSRHSAVGPPSISFH
jgi:hypothetical protein